MREFGANSAEARLVLAKDAVYRDWRELDETDRSTPSLELTVQHRKLFDLKDSYGDSDSSGYIEDDEARADAVKQLKSNNPDWVDDMRRIEALDNDATSEQIERWVDRGKMIDEFGAGSSEAKVWLLDNPDAHKWALDNELLTDGGSDWNEDVLRLNVQWAKEDDLYKGYGDKESDVYIEDDDARAEARVKLLENEAYRKDVRRREALGKDFPFVETYVNYYEEEGKGFRQERMLVEDKAFGEAMHTILGVDIPDKVPAVQYDDIYDANKDLFDEIDGLANFKSEFYIEDEDKRQTKRDKIFFSPDGTATDFYKEFKRREAFGNFVPDEHTENYVSWFVLGAEGKPDGYPNIPYYEDDFFLMEHPDFYKNVYLNEEIWGSKNDRRDFRLVPLTRKLLTKWIDYNRIQNNQTARDQFRLDNSALDEWGVSVGIWAITMSEKRRRAEQTATEKFEEAVAEAEKKRKELLKK